MIEIIKGMDDPSYIVLQKNGRYAEVVRYKSKNKARSAWAVLDFGEWKYQELLNGYPNGNYNVLVTSFEPDNLIQYLNREGNVIIYEKAKGAVSSGSNRSWFSHSNTAPFADDSVVQTQGNVNDRFNLKTNTGSEENRALFENAKKIFGTTFNWNTA